MTQTRVKAFIDLSLAKVWGFTSAALLASVLDQVKDSIAICASCTAIGYTLWKWRHEAGKRQEKQEEND